MTAVSGAGRARGTSTGSGASTDAAIEAATTGGKTTASFVDRPDEAFELEEDDTLEDTDAFLEEVASSAKSRASMLVSI